jgi:YcxB-like protein
MENNDTIMINVQLTSGDLRDLWRGSPIRHLALPLIAIGLFYSYLVVAEIMNEGLTTESAFPIILYGTVALVALLGVLSVPRLRARLMLRYDPTLRELRRYSLSKQGARLESELMTCDCRWGAFFSIVETRRSFLLYLSPLFGMVIPKKSLSEPDDTGRMRDLFRAHFKGRLKLRG